MSATPAWSSLDAARAHDAARRVPFLIDGVAVGSVARVHLDSLARWREHLEIGADGVRLTSAAEARDAALAQINAGLRRDGLVSGWRDETYAVVDPTSLRTMARLERATARFWGTLTIGAHCNGYLADAAGRPQWLWIARRAASKATDPGKLDNLIGGGVPHDQTPRQTLVREGWEEAGLRVEQMSGALPGRVVHLLRDIPEGLQHERIHVFDLSLPASLQPRNQDGEVSELRLLPVAQALALAAGDEMTVDASLVTLDFALRHNLLPAGDAGELARRAQDLLR
jgi:8-oxo-dGTP pyrophosphatase MutT (NUDIX family)